MRHKKLSLLPVLLVLCCFANPFCQLTQAAENGLQAPSFRLPTAVAPVRYSLNLTVVPDQDAFTGAVDIDLNFKEASPVLWLNAEKLTVRDSTLTWNGQTLNAKGIPQPKDLVGFSFDHTVGPGPAKLHINYQGEISRKDEPGYKVPWQVTLNVPSDDGAFSNTPVLSEEPVSGGMKTVKFAETKPLPSYLVAIAVGPMDVIDAGHAGANHTAIRIIVPRGHSSEAEYSASTTGDVLNLLEKYFAIPYPFEKLDEVAIPRVGYAIEHPRSEE